VGGAAGSDDVFSAPNPAFCSATDEPMSISSPVETEGDADGEVVTGNGTGRLA
jgi:hypothetical protein